MTVKIYHQTIETVLGQIFLAASEKGLCMLEFDNKDRISQHFQTIQKHIEIEKIEQANTIINSTHLQLTAFLNKELFDFDLPLDIYGTVFQRKVWAELLTIPYGVTKSYKEQAIAIGDLKAIRAVATANGQNMISIIVPCHRVIGSDGSLTGYGGEIWRKKKLLELESKQQKLF